MHVINCRTHISGLFVARLTVTVTGAGLLSLSLSFRLLWTYGPPYLKCGGPEDFWGVTFTANSQLQRPTSIRRVRLLNLHNLGRDFCLPGATTTTPDST